MRIGRTSTICLLLTGAVCASFSACGGDGSGSDGNTAGTNSSGTGPIIIAGGSGGAPPAGGTSGTGTGAGGTTVIIDGDAACVAEPRAGEQIPLDLFFMVDKSGSMGCPVGAAGQNCTSGPMPAPAVTRWTSIKDALNAFANAPGSAGISMGMGFFPQLRNGTSGAVLCTPQDYSTPTPAIQALPAAAAGISAALNGVNPSGNTPTVPSLSGAISYVQGYAQTHPGRTVAIVFATDGEPTDCMPGNNIPGAVMVARAAAMATPPIKTYVLGVGPALGNLNQIAAAGGSNTAYLVEGSGSQELLNALNAIRKNALTCDYSIPVTGKPLDFNTVNVKTRVGANGMEQLIRQVQGLSECTAVGGWYYDNPSAPTRIQLCPATCDPLVATAGSGLTVLIGCGTVIIPPK